MALSKIVGRNIKYIRETKGIKQVNLANTLELSPQTLSYMENGKSEITIRKLEQIAKALEVNVTDFFSKSNYEDPMAQRKKILEDAAIGLVNMYNDQQGKNRNETYMMQQLDKIAEMMHVIIELLHQVIVKNLNNWMNDQHSLKLKGI
jgi:transcriptional regulator with XRE-family HTH domain